MRKEAYISWGRDEDEGCYLIAHLWVPVEERGQGKGRKLLREAVAEMRNRAEYSCIKLAADSESEDRENPIELADLVEFYESEGFSIEYAGEIVSMIMDI